MTATMMDWKFLLWISIFIGVSSGEPPLSQYGAPQQQQQQQQRPGGGFSQQGYNAPPPPPPRQMFSFTGPLQQSQQQGYSAQGQGFGGPQPHPSYGPPNFGGSGSGGSNGQQPQAHGFVSTPQVIQQSYGPPPTQAPLNFGGARPQGNFGSTATSQPQPQQSFGGSSQQSYGPPVAAQQNFGGLQQSPPTHTQQTTFGPQQFGSSSSALQQNYGAPAAAPSSPGPQPQSPPPPTQETMSSNPQKYGPPGYIPPPPLGLVLGQEPPSSCSANDPNSNKQLVVRFYREVFGEHNTNNLEQYLGPTYIQHNPMVADGVEAFKAFVEGDPSFTVEVLRMAADGDLVWVHSKARFFGTSYAVVDIFRFECGKIVEHWDVLQDTKLQNPSANDHPFF